MACPVISNEPSERKQKVCSHVSQMACSQQGSLYALTASLLQIAQRNLIGMSSGASELAIDVSKVPAQVSRYDAVDVLN